MNIQLQEAAPSSRSPQAFSAWQSLVSGRYCITNRYDRAGKRYLVAEPNPDQAVTPLTSRQAHALAYRARGATLKVIAFDLGVSVGTVARDLSLAMNRIGLESSADLAAVFGHVAS